MIKRKILEIILIAIFYYKTCPQWLNPYLQIIKTKIWTESSEKNIWNEVAGLTYYIILKWALSYHIRKLVSHSRHSLLWAVTLNRESYLLHPCNKHYWWDTRDWPAVKRELTAFAEEPGSIPSNQMVPQSCLQLQY